MNEIKPQETMKQEENELFNSFANNQTNNFEQTNTILNGNNNQIIKLEFPTNNNNNLINNTSMITADDGSTDQTAVKRFKNGKIRKTKQKSSTISAASTSSSITGSKNDTSAKLERSRQSARECRARKKLRYQYLEKSVSLSEAKTIGLMKEFNQLIEIATKLADKNCPNVDELQVQYEKMKRRK